MIAMRYITVCSAFALAHGTRNVGELSSHVQKVTTSAAEHDMMQALETDPCKFAADYDVEVKVQSGWFGGSSKSFLFEPVQNLIVTLGKDCESLRTEKAAGQNVSERMAKLKEEILEEDLACEKVGEQHSIKHAQACFDASDPQIQEAQEKVKVELGKVTALAEAEPEFLKQEKTSWFGKTENNEEVWCEKATSFRTTAGQFFNGVSLSLSKKDEEKEAEQKVKTDFTNQCSLWHAAQEEVLKLQSQKSSLESTLESKKIELTCLSIPLNQLKNPTYCSKFNKSLPDTQEAITSKGEKINADAARLVDLMNQKNTEIGEIGRLASSAIDDLQEPSMALSAQPVHGSLEHSQSMASMFGQSIE